MHYILEFSDPQAHVLSMTFHIPNPHPNGEQIQMPTWIPGSYLIREFAKQVIQIQANDADENEIAIYKIDKHTWQTAAAKTPVLKIRYQIYAYDFSVRTARFDAQSAFLNLSSLCLYLPQRRKETHSIEIKKAKHNKNWQVAATLAQQKLDKLGFGSYKANTYDELIDNPILCGELITIPFMAEGVEHRLVIDGYIPKLDQNRLAEDLTKICSQQLQFFKSDTTENKLPPYQFLLTVLDEAYGGIEHCNNSALLCSRNDLPVLGQTKRSKAYIDFLALCSHEYFHRWCVKRLCPLNFINYDLQQENYTELLWFFEGFTSYYDDLFVLRSGLMSPEQYLERLAKTINQVYRNYGRMQQSLAESSFDAWIKYYRPDENTLNSVVSYYQKGSLVALALDLNIRQRKAKTSLDDVMRALYQDYATQGKGITRTDIHATIKKVVGKNWPQAASYLDQAVDQTDQKNDLKLQELFSELAIDWVMDESNAKPSLGVRIAYQGNDLKVSHIAKSLAAEQAGLSTGDILVALDDLRITRTDNGNNLDQLLSPYQVNEQVVLHVFRKSRLLALSVVLQAEKPMLNLKIKEASSRRDEWLW